MKKTHPIITLYLIVTGSLTALMCYRIGSEIFDALGLLLVIPLACAFVSIFLTWGITMAYLFISALFGHPISWREDRH